MCAKLKTKQDHQTLLKAKYCPRVAHRKKTKPRDLDL